MKKILTCICIYLALGYCTPAYSQRPFIGIGYLECLHVGARIHLSKNVHWETSAGLKPYSFSKSEIFTFNNTFSFLSKNRLQKPKLYLCAQSMLWYFNNPWNRFVNLSVGPALKIDFPNISRFADISLNLGCAYNNVLLYHRKTFQEVGWPGNWHPSFALLILKKEKKQ